MNPAFSTTYAALDRFGLLSLVGVSGAALAAEGSVAERKNYFSTHPISMHNFATPAPHDAFSLLVSETIRRTEQRFFATAFDAARREAKVAQLALERSAHPRVLALAGSLVERAEILVGEIAQRAQLAQVHDYEATVEASVPETWELPALPMDQFDAAFLNAVNLAQEDLVALFEDAARGLPDPEMRAFAARHLGNLLGDLAKTGDLKKGFV